MICQGRLLRRIGTCSAILFKCKKCGNTGCDRNQPGECDNQAFISGRCMVCGSSFNKQRI